MSQHRPAKSRIALLLLGAAASCVPAGCNAVIHPIVVAEATSATPFTAFGGPVVGAMAPLFIGGPMLIFQNETTHEVSVRYWIGRVDVTAPGGVADVRTAKSLAFNLEPGKQAVKQTGRNPWPTGTHDAVVRLEAREKLADGTMGESVWWEFTRPAPYTIRVREDSEGKLVWERLGNGQLVEVPPDLRPIGRNGEFPVYAADAAQVTSAKGE